MEKVKPMPRVIVVGAGAAGLLAAGSAASNGAQVILLEKMRRPARKLRITGKGRCNVTNTAPLAEFVGHFGKNGRFLRPAFSRFFAAEMLTLLRELGVEHVTERGGRVFPASQKAQDVVDALVGWVRRLGVELRTETPVTRLLQHDARVAGVVTPGGELRADAVILAVGGASYPRSGSTGDGYAMAAAAGHRIVPVRPALVPLVTADDTAGRLQGLSLRNVAASVWVAGRKRDTAFGEMLFTHFGVSGPIVLSLSRAVIDLLDRDDHGGAAGGSDDRVELAIDLKPALDHAKLDARLLRDVDAHGKRQFATLLKDLLPRKLIPVCIDLTGIPADLPAHQLSGTQRKALRVWLKDFRLTVVGHRPLAEAIVTAGGVDLCEIDAQTLQSKLVSGLYLTGELLDLDATTGGYNVQAAFSTGWVAGVAAATASAAPPAAAG